MRGYNEMNEKESQNKVLTKVRDSGKIYLLAPPIGTKHIELIYANCKQVLLVKRRFSE